ncbi:MAG: ribonuclease R [Selenomonadaceae bacterium]|nr:ribonuclease R [Selenomonadaceae bacterium]
MAKSKHTNAEVVSGRLVLNPRGFGFVEPEVKQSNEDTDIFIRAEYMAGAMHGDKVKVLVTKPYNERTQDKREGKIIKIVERVNKSVVGTYRIEDIYHFVSADDLRLPQLIFIQNYRSFKDLEPGMKVVVEITDYDTAYDTMTGKIIEVLGQRKEPGVDILAILRRYNVYEEFPNDVMEAAAKIETEPSEVETAKRIDRRTLKIVTIDGADAKDLDDGVYAERQADGNYFLGVYIADVSHYVKANDAIDIEAFERGTSIYPVDRVVPMLPKELSNGICSLNAGCDRLAMACEMTLDTEGTIINYKIFPTVIHVHKRLTYTAVNKFFDSDDDEVNNLSDIASMLETLKIVRELRKTLRTQRGAIDFDIAEMKVILDDNGRPTKIIKREQNLAESVIEECMLAANETVAKHMYDLHKPSIYRVHEQPEEEKIDQFNDLLATFGLHVNKQPNGKVKPKDVQNVLNKITNKRDERIISTIALRTMQQAYYSPDCSGHFGLAAKFYTHFTSPIRRYPDLIVHRLLYGTFDNKNRQDKTQEANMLALLSKIAKQSSARERRAVDIERETTELKAVEYMGRFVGKVFDSVIISVTRFGFFVELDNGVDGLVRIESLMDDYYIYVESDYSIVGRRTGKTFRIGDEVKVRLIEANIQLRQLTFLFISRIVESENLIVE